MLQLLTAKPALYVCNVDEASAEHGNALSELVAERAAQRQRQGGGDLGQDRERDRHAGRRASAAEFLETLGLTEPGLNRLIREAYALLGLQTYFTAGPKESRAWTIPVGATAPQAAGVIHTDFEKGFIRAETIAYDDYVRAERRGRRARGRQAARRGQGLRRARRRRDELPLQRLSPRRTVDRTAKHPQTTAPRAWRRPLAE